MLLSKDTRLRKRPLELAALVNNNVRAFYITAGELTGREIAALLVKVMPRMLRMCKARPPFIARITRMGDVDRLPLPKYVDASFLRTSAPT